jgi:hypothetical protein
MRVLIPHYCSYSFNFVYLIAYIILNISSELSKFNTLLRRSVKDLDDTFRGFGVLVVISFRSLRNL